MCDNNNIVEKKRHRMCSLTDHSHRDTERERRQSITARSHGDREKERRQSITDHSHGDTERERRQSITTRSHGDREKERRQSITAHSHGDTDKKRRRSITAHSHEDTEKQRRQSITAHSHEDTEKQRRQSITAHSHGDREKERRQSITAYSHGDTEKQRRQSITTHSHGDTEKERRQSITAHSHEDTEKERRQSITAHSHGDTEKQRRQSIIAHSHEDTEKERRQSITAHSPGDTEKQRRQSTTVDNLNQCRTLEPQDCVHGILKPAGSNDQWIISHAQVGSHKFLTAAISHHHDVTATRTPPPPRLSSKAQASLCQSFPPFTNPESQLAAGPGHPYDATVKVILLGDYNVGKTSMLRSLSRVKDENGCGCCCEFRPGELVTTILKRDRKRSLVKVMDTGGQEKYRSMTSSYYRGVHGCLLVFDITREETFANIMNWHQDLNKYTGDQFVTSILVGTTSHPAPRAVTPERAFKMAESLGIMYLECDVKDDVMITVIIQRLLDIVIRAGLRRISNGIEIKPQEPKKSNGRSFCSC